MASCRGLLAISFFLFILKPAYCIRSSNWDKNSTELKGNSTQNRKEISAKSTEATVIVVNKQKDQGHFTTVQEAIDAVPVNNQNPVVIEVYPGIYREKVQISADKPFITLVGYDASNTVITWNDSSKSTSGTFASATLSVYASDFVARDITIENSFGPGDRGPNNQAVALKISGDRCAFYNSRFLGYQDTLLDESGKHYFRNCYIEGAIDFICGNGKSIYESCELHSIPIYTGVFTAQKRSSPSEDSGFVFLQCKLTGKGLNYLGKPWGAYSTVVFANTEMDDIIFPKGWTDWTNEIDRENTVTYIEFNSSGPGAAENGRVSWSNVVTDSSQAAQYLSLNYIDGSSWIQ